MRGKRHSFWLLPRKQTTCGLRRFTRRLTTFSAKARMTYLMRWLLASRSWVAPKTGLSFAKRVMFSPRQLRLTHRLFLVSLLRLVFLVAMFSRLSKRRIPSTFKGREAPRHWRLLSQEPPAPLSRGHLLHTFHLAMSWELSFLTKSTEQVFRV